MNIAPLMRIVPHMEVVSLLLDSGSMTTEAIAEKLGRNELVLELALEELADADVLWFDVERWRIDPEFMRGAIVAEARAAMLKYG